MYKVKGKVRKPTPAMRKVLDGMKSGQGFLTMRQIGKRKVYQFGDKVISAHTIKGLVDRYLIREVRRDDDPGDRRVISIFLLLTQKKPGDKP